MLATTKTSGWFHLMAAVTVSVWGTTFVSTKILIGHGLSPADILLYRFILAYVCIFFFSYRKLLSNSWRDELFFVAIGLCGGSLYFVVENTAVGITLASNVSLIICTTPILTALLSRLFYKGKKLQKRLVGGSLLALLGVGLVVFNGCFILKINPLGDMLTLVAAFLWAFYCVVPLRINPEILFRPVVMGNLLFLGVVASMLCYLMWNTTVKRLGVLRTTNYIYVVPLVTLLTSAIIIDETITGVALLGSVLILGGVYIAERGFGKWH